MVARRIEDDPDQTAAFELDLLVIHPVMPADAISSELGLTPSFSWTKGDASTSAGSHVPGPRSRTAWRHTFVRRSSDVGLTIDDVLGSLATHRAFFRRVSSEGGTSDLVLRFPGSRYFGFNFSERTLDTVARCHLQFGVEVFPDWKPDEA
jgi:hypothetical protein